jgi:hypothetical protein
LKTEIDGDTCFIAASGRGIVSLQGRTKGKRTIRKVEARWVQQRKKSLLEK